MHYTATPLRHMPCVFLTLTLVAVGLVSGAGIAAAQAPGNLERVEYESSDGTTGYRRLVNRQESGNRTLESWVVEAPSVNGGYSPLLQVEEETIQVDAETTRVTRQEFTTDPDGRQTLLERVDEERISSPGGGESVVRDVSQVDVNGRMQRVRRETETTTRSPDGTYQTEIEVLRSSINRSGLVPTEQMIETGRTDADGRILESDLTTYSDPTGRGNWAPLERRIATHDYGEQEVAGVESIYRLDPNGELALSEQIVSRQWTDAAGREQMSEDVYSTDIPGQRSARNPQLLRQVSSTRTESPGGGWEFTREVRESRQGRFRVVERETETAQANRNGGVDVERVVEALDGNGRLEPVQNTTYSEQR